MNGLHLIAELHELDGPDALPDLIVRLLVESGVSHHHVP